MGTKNLKAIAVKGSKMPPVADHRKFLARLKSSRRTYNSITGRVVKGLFRDYGTAFFLQKASDDGHMTVKNFAEGTLSE